jgi:hypothetical protein
MNRLRHRRYRRILLLLAAGLGSAGCEDAVGFGGSCAAEMREVQRERGQPVASRTERLGDFTEVWRYPDRVYTFRWGVSYPQCEVTAVPLASLEPPPG